MEHEEIKEMVEANDSMSALLGEWVDAYTSSIVIANHKHGTSAGELINKTRDFMDEYESDKEHFKRKFRKEFQELKKGETVVVTIDDQITVNVEMEWLECENCNYDVSIIKNPDLSEIVHNALDQYIEENNVDDHPEVRLAVKAFDKKISDFSDRIAEKSSEYDCNFWDYIY